MHPPTGVKAEIQLHALPTAGHQRMQAESVLGAIRLRTLGLLVLALNRELLP